MNARVTEVVLLGLCLAPSIAQAGGDAAKGQLVFQRCVSCHSVDSKKHGKGPTLMGMVGRSVAAVPGYPYSAAMKAFASEHPVWDEATLDLFLTAPMDVVKGTKMSAPPVRRETERLDLIAFLKSL